MRFLIPQKPGELLFAEVFPNTALGNKGPRHNITPVNGYLIASKQLQAIA